MKRVVSALATIIISLICLLSASALTDEESTLRKRAYYAGIDSTISLLSDKLGNLSNATIERIVVTSLQDFTSEESVKENVQSETGKFLLIGYTIDVSVEFSANNGDCQQNYVFDHYLPAGNNYYLTSLEHSNIITFNYKNAISYFSDYGYSIGNGIAHTTVFNGYYYLDIDLNDYQNSGYSLALPYVHEQPSESTSTTATADSATVPPPEKAQISSASTTEEPPLQSPPNTSSSSPKSESISSSSASKSSSSVKSAPSSAYKKVGLMVWIPTNGGKRYHSNSSCSGMINPRRVDLGEARYLGFTACGRCYR